MHFSPTSYNHLYYLKSSFIDQIISPILDNSRNFEKVKRIALRNITEYSCVMQHPRVRHHLRDQRVRRREHA